MSFKKIMGSYDFSISFLSKNEIDIIDYDKCEERINKNNPEVVINCTAYTDVEKAESDECNAKALNVIAVKISPKYVKKIMPYLYISQRIMFLMVNLTNLILSVVKHFL